MKLLAQAHPARNLRRSRDQFSSLDSSVDALSPQHAALSSQLVSNDELPGAVASCGGRDLGTRGPQLWWSCSESCLAVSHSLRPRGLYSPWNSPGQSTGVGCHSLLQGIFLTQRLNWSLLHCRWILHQLSYQQGARSLPTYEAQNIPSANGRS